MREYNSIDEVRESIDKIDHQIIKLLSKRSKLVEQAATFKKSESDVRAPNRVEAVIEKVRNIANENNVSPDIVEEVYRTMIACFINHELTHHSKTNH